MKICFHANLSRHKNWREMLQKVEFYKTDIQLLQDLGYEVTIAGKPSALDPGADAYYCWWWGHSLIPILLGRLRGKPVVVTGAFDYSTCRKELPGLCYLDRPAWQKMVMRCSLRLATANLFISAYEFEEVTGNLRVTNPLCAPLAIDTDFYSYKPTDYLTGSDNDPFFFSISWLSKANVIRKGLRQTIEAFSLVARKHKRVRLKVAGKPGDYQDDLLQLVRQSDLSGRVDFLGMIAEDEKRDYYRRAVAYVQPSLYEGFGLAIGEAMACGCRVITSDRGAVPEVVAGHGICVDPLDVGGIAHAMQTTLTHSRTKLECESAVAWIKRNFSIRRRRDLLKDVLSSVL